MKKLQFIIYFLVSVSVFSQPLNDDCFTAINIPSIDEWCSENAEFSNEGGTPDPEFTNNCFINNANGVWFSFVPTEPAILFQLFSGNEIGSLEDPKMALFEGPCDDLTYVDCSPGRSFVSDEFQVSDLTLGQRYYLFVEAGVGFEGTFKLCINDFIAPPSPEADCISSVVLCDKTPFVVENLSTSGNDPNELSDFADQCLSSEFRSSWYTWTCKDAGSLTFTLTPNDYIPGIESDDLDFAVFELPGGLDDCDNKVMIRCMASGANGFGGVTAPFEEWQICNGPTGLMIGDGDLREEPGCQDGNNNFVEALQMEEGKSYALVVMNFSRGALGFDIEFGGTGTFLGPEPDFDLETIDAFECDKRITITNSSLSETDSIVSYAWNFGFGANPLFSTGEGPHEVVYESFGNKSIALTVETSRGCALTRILDIYVEPCCMDTSTLDITATTLDVSCFGEADGAIAVEGISGAPEYNYSLDGGAFVPNSAFQNLQFGTYDVTVQDIKGCEVTTQVTIAEPEEIVTDAGDNIEIDLGFTGQLMATYSPQNPGDSIVWSPAEGLSCSNCLNPEVIAPGNTTYSFTVIDANGCEVSDFVTVTTRIVRPIYIPNVITPTTQDVNSTFFIGLGPQVDSIEEFEVYDRWGNLIFSCNNIAAANAGELWKGQFGACNDSFLHEVDPGVYVWKANIRFIDDEVITYSDDLTILR